MVCYRALYIDHCAHLWSTQHKPLCLPVVGALYIDHCAHLWNTVHTPLCSPVVGTQCNECIDHVPCYRVLCSAHAMHGPMCLPVGHCSCWMFYKTSPILSFVMWFVMKWEWEDLHVYEATTEQYSVVPCLVTLPCCFSVCAVPRCGVSISGPLSWA